MVILVVPTFQGGGIGTINIDNQILGGVWMIKSFYSCILHILCLLGRINLLLLSAHQALPLVQLVNSNYTI